MGKVKVNWRLRGDSVAAGAGVTATYFWLSERPEIVKREYFPDCSLLVKNI